MRKLKTLAATILAITGVLGNVATAQQGQYLRSLSHQFTSLYEIEDQIVAGQNSRAKDEYRPIEESQLVDILIAQERQNTRQWKEVVVWIIDSYDADSADLLSHGEVIEKLIQSKWHGEILRSSVGIKVLIDPDQPLLGRKTMIFGQMVNDAFDELIRWGNKNPDTFIVVNMSWGTNSRDDRFRRVLDVLGKYGYAFVAAAGNDGQPICTFPAGYAAVVAVGAAEENGNIFERAKYSNYGSCVDVVVPLERESILMRIGQLEKVYQEMVGIISNRGLRPMSKNEMIDTILSVNGTSIAAALVSAILAYEVNLYNKYQFGRHLYYRNGELRWSEMLKFSSVKEIVSYLSKDSLGSVKGFESNIVLLSR